jgi:hypothetical protein
MGEAVRAYLGAWGDVDVFRFRMERAGWVRVQGLPWACATRLVVKDGAGKELGSSWNYAGHPVLFDTECAAAGWYAVEMTEPGGHPGDSRPYEFRLDSILDDGKDDPAPAKGRVTAVREMDMNGLAGSLLEPTGDVHTYRLALPSAGVVNVRGVGATGLHTALVSADGKDLASSWNYATHPFGFQWACGGPQTVYLRVRCAGGGDSSAWPYAVSAWHQPCDEQDAVVRNDTFETATAAEMAEPFRGSISPPGDVDVFRFSVDHAGWMEVEGRGRTALRLVLLDARRREIASSWNYATHPMTIRAQVVPGEYYLMVQATGGGDWHPGPYQALGRLYRADPVERGALDKDPVRLLRLGEAQAFAIEHAGDVDRFRFSVTDKGRYLARAMGPLGTVMLLRDELTGKDVGSTWNYGGHPVSVGFDAAGPTRYVMEIRATGGGDRAVTSGYVLVDAKERPLLGEEVWA